MAAQCYLYYGKKSSDNKQLIFQSYVIDTGRTIFQPSVLSADGNEIKNRVNLIDTLYICINWNVLLLFLRNFSKFYLLISMLIKEEDVIERAQWKNGVEFLMSCVAFSVGLGNIWRFPYTAYKNGGGAFLIPYIVVLFVIGKPFYYMEMILGQFTSSSCIQIWSVSPLFQGILLFFSRKNQNLINPGKKVPNRN